MPIPQEVARKTGLRSFLIGDVRGYTRFTAEHGDEAAAHLAATFAGLAREAVEARGGRVIELRGDEILAVFDVAAQSVRAARELQWTCIEEVARDPSLPLLVGIGIAAGEAVPVEEGFRGAALNLAARLCSTAAAGEVLVSAWLAELAGTIEGATFSDRGEVQLKGFPNPVPFLEVSGTRDTPPPVAELDGPPPPLPPELDTGLPLIAREHEVRWARGTWRQVRRGAGRVVVVSGPSGIGKTRLAAEIAAGVEGTGGRVHYAGAGGTAIADTLAAIEDARTTSTPTMVILDDLDAAGDRAATELAQALDVIRHRPALVLALAQRIDASGSLAALVEVVDALGDGHRALGPLDLDGVREICRVYAGEEVAEAPIETIARSSGGVPGRVHESMSEWAREEASRRLEAAAEWLTVGRERRAAGLGFANNVIGLKLDRIYRVPDHGAVEESACPYKGLASYGPGDAAFFFGREALVGELAARTVGVGLLGVMGASGSGKSSVVAAGLRSSLEAGLLPGSARWDQVSMRPGNHPIAELASVLRTVAPDATRSSTDAWVDAIGRNERLVLCIDQFEEIFTACDDPDEVEEFVHVLTDFASHPERVVVVLALRGDFYGHTAAHPVLAQMLNANHVLVGPMSAEELRRAIELPSRRAGVRVESALVDRLVGEVGEAAGGLPLLSTALVELWEQREGGWLRLEAYERSGGMRGAVARLAEQTFGELGDAEREATPSVFLRLVGPGEGEAVTRRRVPLDEFDTESDPAAAEVLRRFTRDRLLTADDRSVEVSHEALLREWPRLRTWLAEDARGRELRVHLTAAARVWQQDGKEDSELYRGARLSSAIDWAALHGRQLNELEREFLTASRQRSERETERQRRTNRRLRGLLAGVALFLVFALVAGSIALVQRGRARTSAAAAQVSATQALAQSLGAKGFAQPQLSRALLLAHEGTNLAPSDDTEGSMLSTLLRAPEVLHTYTAPESERPLQVGPIDDGRILGVAMNSGDADFYDVATGATLGVYDGSKNFIVTCCGPATGGDAIAVIQSAKRLVPEVIDPRSGSVVRTFANDPYLSTQSGTGGLYSFDPAGSRDGRWFYLGYSTGNSGGAPQPGLPTWIDRWDIASGRLVSHVGIGKGSILALDLANGDSTIAASTGRGTTLVDAGSMRVVKRIPYRTNALAGATNENATITAFADSQFGVIDFADLRTGIVTHGLGNPMTQTQFISFSPMDPQLAISSGDDGNVVRWDANKASVAAVLPIHASRIPNTTFSSDGSKLFSASLDGTASEIALAGPAGFGSEDQIIDLGTTTVGDVLATNQTPVAAAGVERSAYSTGDAFVSVIDAATGGTTRFAGAPSGSHIVSMALAPDGRTLVVGAESPDYTSGTVWLWDVSATPRLVRRLPLDVPDRSVNVVTFADQGREVIAGTGLIPLSGSIKGGYLVGWTTSNGARAFAPIRFPGNVVAQFAISPAGALGAVGLSSENDSSVQLLRLPSNELVGKPTSMDLTSLAFTEDGSLVTGGYDGTAQRRTVPDLQPAGKPILTGGGPVETVEPEPHAPYFLTTNFDGTTKIWSLAAGQEVGTSLTPQENVLMDASVSPDGSLVAVASQLGSVWTFPLLPQVWNDDACTVAGRNLTPTEWAQFVGSRPYGKVCRQYPLLTP